MTERSFKVGDVISMDDIDWLRKQYIIKAIQDNYINNFIEIDNKYINNIKLKIVSLPEVD